MRSVFFLWAITYFKLLVLKVDSRSSEPNRLILLLLFLKPSIDYLETYGLLKSFMEDATEFLSLIGSFASRDLILPFISLTSLYSPLILYGVILA